MSFTTTLFSPAPMRGLSGMLYKWLPENATPNASAAPAVSAVSTPTQRTTLGKRKRDPPVQPTQTPIKPKRTLVEPRPYSMRNRTAKSYAEIDSDDELIDESEVDPDSASDYGVAPRKKPKKTKPLPKSQIFPLLRLPRELRDMIYAHVLTDPIGAVYVEERTHRYRRLAARTPAGPQSHLANHGHWAEQRPSQAMPRWPVVDGHFACPANGPPPAPHAAALTPALLAVCRRVRDEATPVLYAQPMVFGDAAALHAFLAPLPPPARAALREVTVLGIRGGWGRSMRAAFDVAALTLLAEGATRLNVLRYHDEYYRGEPDDGPHRAARRFYRRAFHWLNAVAGERGVDEAVGAVQFIGADNEVWGRDDPNVPMADYWVELRKLVVKGLRRRRGEGRGY